MAVRLTEYYSDYENRSSVEGDDYRDDMSSMLIKKKKKIRHAPENEALKASKIKEMNFDIYGYMSAREKQGLARTNSVA